MRKLFIFSLFSLSIVSAAWAQDSWREGNNGVEFDCSVYLDAVALIESEDQEGLIALSGEPFIRYSDGRDELTLGAYLTNVLYVTVRSGEVMDWGYIFTSMSEACADSDEGTTNSEPIEEAQFNVVTAQAVNLRECAGTTCAIVRQSRAGEVFAVLGSETAADGEWYEVRLENGTAFVSAPLTSRGPDQIIDISEPFIDSRTGCYAVFDVNRGDADLYVIISGESRDEVIVDIFRPSENSPLRVEGQLDKTFIDSGDPYIHQYYRYNIGWPMGLYNLQIDYGGETTKVAWQMEERGSYRIYVQCE